MDIDTILLDTEDRMEKAMAALERDFQKLRTGRATTALVDGIKADYYGTPTPIKQLASVAVPDSRTVTIQPWDRGAFSLVEKAILKINPAAKIEICEISPIIGIHVGYDVVGIVHYGKRGM